MDDLKQDGYQESFHSTLFPYLLLVVSGTPAAMGDFK